MLNTFEISETPTLENTSAIVKDAMRIKTTTQPTMVGKSSIFKIMLDGIPFYHFNSRDFDLELATRNQSVVVSGKRFYMGLKNTPRHTKMKLRSMV